MKPWTLVIVIALVVVGVMAYVRANNSEEPAENPPGADISGSALSVADVTFLTAAAQAGAAEINLARLAEDTSETKAVDELADHLERDHSATNDQINALADRKKVDFPNDAIGLPGPTDEQRATRDRLATLKGAAFDRAYLDQAEQDHRKSIDAFSNATGSSDPDVKYFAERTLPILQQHLQHVQEAQKAVGQSREGRR
jgi:putative membrane protein